MPLDDTVPIPAIVGPVQYSRSQANPPVLRLDLGALRYFAIELASDPALFDPANANLRTSETFYASWTTGMLGPVEETTYAVPQDAWQKLSAKPAIYYRVVTSTAGDSWKSAAASTSNAGRAAAPRIALTG